jgi:hypothetical protein
MELTANPAALSDGDVTVTEKKTPQGKRSSVHVTQPTVEKKNRGASIAANANVRTDVAIDFVNAVRGR